MKFDDIPKQFNAKPLRKTMKAESFCIKYLFWQNFVFDVEQKSIFIKYNHLINSKIGLPNLKFNRNKKPVFSSKLSENGKIR